MDTLFPSPAKPLRIGTRGSALALAQAFETQSRLACAHNLDKSAFEIVKIQTTGDKFAGQKLADIGQKGLFVKEIEEQLLSGAIDIAVHSLKDMPVEQPEGLILGAILEREDPRDALIAKHPDYKGIADLPQGAVVATSSTRRGAQIQNLRPDIEIITIRGNVGTRVGKIATGYADASFLAMAGLKRLRPQMGDMFENLPPPQPVDPEIMLPAPGQGAICIEHRLGEDAIEALLAPLNHLDSAFGVQAERAFLKMLDSSSCTTPIAALAEIKGNRLAIAGEILSPDGVQKGRARLEGAKRDAHALGTQLGRALLAKNISFHD